jgi:hypothetical protein
MKSTIIAVTWTIIFLAFSIHFTNKIIDFTNDISKNVDIIETYVNENEWEKSIIEIDKIDKLWSEEKKFWYKILDHAPFEQANTHIKTLKDASKIQDKASAYEQIELLRGQIKNIQGNIRFGLDYIL